jgi:leader peptidase (prepilin peptidase)/N-methyltransferase
LIHWYDNVPLVSWLVLRGKCRYCRAPISARYPLVELITGLLFWAAYQRFGISWGLASALAMTTCLVPLTWIDLEHWILPFELTLPGIAAGIVLAAPQGVDRLRDAAIGAAGGFVLFWLLEKVGRWAFQKEALGAGDKYLLALLGAFLTYKPMMGLVLLSSLQGSVVGLTLLAVRGRAGPAPEEAAGKPTSETTYDKVESLGTESAPPAEPSPNGLPAAEPVSAETASKASSDEEDDWEPGPTNMPFGPWLALSGLEILLLGPWLWDLLPPHLSWLILGSPGGP